MKRKAILGAALALLAFLAASAQQTAPAPDKVKTDNAELRRQSFEKVWQTINDNHFDPTFGGVDWQKTREIYAPQIAAAKTDAEFYRIMQRMIGELKLSHFSIYPQNLNVDSAAGGGEGTLGIELKMLDGKAVIARIEKDSGAERANLKTGFVVEKVDGKTVAEILAPLEKNLAARGENERVVKLYAERTLANMLNGKPDSIAKIEISDEKNQARNFDVKRSLAKTEMSLAIGNFPAQPVLFESKLLSENIGYIRFNMWTIPQMPKIRQAIRDFAGAKGIVFDLRGNPGGIGGMASGVAGLLMNERATLGSMNSRSTKTEFIVYPQTAPFAGKVIVLTDYGSASTSEVFAAGLQENGRARIVGERSAGAVLPSVFTVLPIGAIFQYPVSDYKSPKNVLIEKRGVAPDTEIKQTRAAFLENKDLPLEEAIRQILN